MRRWHGATLVLLLGLAAAWAQEPPKKDSDKKDEPKGSAAEQLKALQSEYQAETLKIAQAQTQLRRSFALRHVELAEKNPKDPAALQALLWVVRFAANLPEAGKAFDLLADNYAASDEAATLLASNPSLYRSPGAASFLHAVMEANPKEDVKGTACYQLALLLKAQADGGNQDAGKEAERFLEQVIDKHAGIKSGRSTLGVLAKSELTALRSGNRVGAFIPEIEGEGLDGVKFKISDYRGKVVLLDFWGHWCGPCVAMFPRERSLVKRLEAKPFALIGVNSDRDKEVCRKQNEKQQITWRSFWDGMKGTPGPIAKQFDIRGYPTLYLIDAQGVIRHTWLGNPGDKKLDDAIDELITEAEAGKGG